MIPTDLESPGGYDRSIKSSMHKPRNTKTLLRGIHKLFVRLAEELFQRDLQRSNFGFHRIDFGAQVMQVLLQTGQVFLRGHRQFFLMLMMSATTATAPTGTGTI